LGHLTRKKPSPIWPIMCLVGVKPYSINQSLSELLNEEMLLIC